MGCGIPTPGSASSLPPLTVGSAMAVWCVAATLAPVGAAGEQSGVAFCRWKGGGLGSEGFSVEGVVGGGKGMLDGEGWCLSWSERACAGGGRCLSGRGRGCAGRRWSGRGCDLVVEGRWEGVLVGAVEVGGCGW